MLKERTKLARVKDLDPKSLRRPRLKPCNICGEPFRAPTSQCCFCEECKSHSDLYRFHDWLPDSLEAA